VQKKDFSPLASLECLSRVFPIKGAIVVGAGLGQGPWSELLQQQNIEGVVLIEADEANAQHLEKKFFIQTDWKILRQLISDTNGEATFYRYSNVAENGLLEPTQLKELWPNIIATEEAVPLKTVTLDSLQQEMQHHGNWLVIDTLPAITILNGSESLLQNIDVLITREILDSSIHSAIAPTISLIQNHGFICIGTEPGLHPAIGYALYVKVPQHLAPELKQTQHQLKSLETELRKKESAWEEEKVSLQQAAERVTEFEQQIRQLTTTLEVKEDELRDSRKANAELTWHDEQQQAGMQDVLAKQTKLLLDQFEKQNDELKHIHELINNTFSKELFKATSHIESFWSVENYFATGRTPTLQVELTKWPISPDLAMLLIKLIELNTYDLVVEFGSGISTVVIAKALSQQAAKQHRDPAKFVSFEHLDDYYEKTAVQLASAGLDNAVQLELTPLAPYMASDNTIYSYYNCRRVLKKMGKEFKGSRLLVFVDGPPASTGKHARYPALPLILESFGVVFIDMIMDDCKRSDEKDIMSLWDKELHGRYINSMIEKYDTERGVCRLMFRGGR
jgi:hypothetical protein